MTRLISTGHVVNVSREAIFCHKKISALFKSDDRDYAKELALQLCNNPLFRLKHPIVYKYLNNQYFGGVLWHN